MSPYEGTIKYWKGFLQDLQPYEFPNLLSGKHSSQEGFQEVVPVKLDASNPAIQEICSEYHITAASLFQTAWAIVVGCYAGIEDVSFGYSAEYESALAKWASEDSIVCRAQITPGLRVLDTMNEMMRSFERSLAYQGIPHREIQKALGREGQPLYHTELRVQRYSEPTKQDVRNYSQRPNNDEMMEQCDIVACLLLKGDGSLALSTRTRKAKFSAAQTFNIAHTFGKALDELLKIKSRSLVCELDIFSRHDHAQLERWNLVSPIPNEICFQDHFETVAKKTPDAPAICSWDLNLSYNNLSTLSTKIASYLTNLCVVPDTFVLFCFNKSAIAVVSILGILKAGCAFVAIDPSYPVARIEAIQKATKSCVVLAEPAHCHLFQGSVEHIIALEQEWVNKLPLPLHIPKPRVKASNAAYAVFTSGSTGVPKGIVVEHRALCTAALSLASPMHVTSRSRFLQFAAYTFDVSYGDIFVTLFQGGCICIPSEEERVDDLAGAILRMNVNTACLIPSVTRMLRPEDVPSLENLTVGGEALLQDCLEKWAGKVSFTQVYGPSEATIWCAAHENMTSVSTAGNIGRGVASVLWITKSNNHDHLSPIGCIGELLIEGPMLARGYIDAEQTKLAFVENPQWAEVEPGQRRRFYKTGDLARWNDDGTVSFVGRKDTQVKHHGRRIEMGEIEHHLASHSLLRQSLVLLPSTGRFSQHLVAVVALVSCQGSKSQVAELKTLTGAAKKVSDHVVADVKNFLASRVPSYMIPHSWVVVENIPIMISAKMNRPLVKVFVENLQDDHQEHSGQDTRLSINFEDPLQVRLRDIWSRVFDKSASEIGFEQSFFDLGGDSFSAMDFVAGCKAEGITITVRDVVNPGTEPTIRHIASRIRGKLGTDSKTNGRISSDSTVKRIWKFSPVWWDGS